MSGGWRRFWMGLATVGGLARRGFFIPYRHADGVRAPAGYPALDRRFEAAEPAFLDLLAEMDALAPDLTALGREPPPQPRWTQDWFPGLDAAAAYTLVRRLKPARIVEVGSGHSTRFLTRAVRDGGLATQLTAIDPQPRADLAGLPITLIRKTLQEAGTGAFAGLAAGDFAMIDSSHILMPGSDVDLMLNTVLPALPSGVIVHVHDIFLPDGYPASWEWRGYNEQQGVAPLIASGGYDLLFASRYVRTRMAERVAGGVIGRLPLVEGAFEASLWLRKK